MKFADLVKETITSSGTGAFILGGATAPFGTFAAAYAVGDRVPYRAALGNQWEIGVGTKTAGGIARTTVTASTNSGQLVNFGAGAEIHANAGSAQLAKFENGTSTRVLYLSNYCVSDTDLSMYSQKAGVDQRATVQAVLDLAKTLGSLHLVWDVKITLANVPGTDDTLLASSNTTVVALNGCGALQAAGSKGDMWKNANPTTNQNNNWMAINDENITIDGGIWHGNREGQTVKMDVFRFVGVRNLRTRNYKIVRPSGMCYRTINIDGLVNEHYTLDQGVDILTAPNSVFVNTDGMHHHGPYRNGYDNNGTILNCGDDSYALNADDAWGEANFTGRFDNVWGPIDNITVKNLTIRSRLFGMRLLSGGSVMSNIRIKNVKGSSGGYGFVLDNYITPSKCNLPGDGGFRDIEIDGWHMTNSVFSPNADWYQMCMHINAKVEQLVMKNIVKSDFNNIYFPAIRFGEKAKIDQLAIDYTSRNYNGGTYLTDQIDFAPGAVVTMADIKVRAFAASAINGSPVRIQAGATISVLLLDGQAPNFTSMLNNQGTVTTMRDRTVASTVTPPASTWTLSSQAWVEDTANPGNLTYNGPAAGVVGCAKKTAKDAYDGQVGVRVDIKFGKALVQNENLHAAVFVRGASTIPWAGTQGAYYLDFQANKNSDGSNGGITLSKKTSSSDAPIAPTLKIALAIGETYRTDLAASGSGIRAMIQRTSDSYYLQPNGTWAATQANAFGATDTTLAAVAGEVGVYGFSDQANTIQFSNFAPYMAS